jgi:hypothetical protein
MNRIKKDVLFLSFEGYATKLIKKNICTAQVVSYTLIDQKFLLKFIAFALNARCGIDCVSVRSNLLFVFTDLSYSSDTCIHPCVEMRGTTIIMQVSFLSFV